MRTSVRRLALDYIAFRRLIRLENTIDQTVRPTFRLKQQETAGR